MYKSASKRKAHILKNHPGAELPPSIRKLRPAAPGEPDPMLSTHTQLTGTIATAPVCCPHCAKQYSSKVSMGLSIIELCHWVASCMAVCLHRYRQYGKFVFMLQLQCQLITVCTLYFRLRWFNTSERSIQSLLNLPTPSILLWPQLLSAVLLPSSVLTAPQPRLSW